MPARSRSIVTQEYPLEVMGHRRKPLTILVDLVRVFSVAVFLVRDLVSGDDLVRRALALHLFVMELMPGAVGKVEVRLDD